MKIMPLSDERQSAPGKLAREDHPSFNIQNGFKLSVDRVKMWSPVFSIEQSYHDAKKPAQLRHGIRIGFLSDCDNRLTFAMTGRGERMRASGPVHCEVRQLAMVSANQRVPWALSYRSRPRTIPHSRSTTVSMLERSISTGRADWPRA